jgi:hypothetical protein
VRENARRASEAAIQQAMGVQRAVLILVAAALWLPRVWPRLAIALGCGIGVVAVMLGLGYAAIASDTGCTDGPCASAGLFLLALFAGGLLTVVAAVACLAAFVETVWLRQRRTRRRAPVDRRDDSG